MYGKERSREQGRQGNTKLWWAVGLTLGLASIAAFAAIALGLGAGLISEVEKEMQVVGETAWRPSETDGDLSSSGKIEQTTTRIFRREEMSISSDIEEALAEAEEEASSSVVTSPPRRPEVIEPRPPTFTARQASSNIEALPSHPVSTTPRLETTTIPRRVTNSQTEPTRITTPPYQESTTVRHITPPMRPEVPTLNSRNSGSPPLKEAVRQVTTNKVVSETVTRRPSPRFEMTPTLPTVVGNHLDDQISYPLDSIIGNSSSLVSLGLLAVDLLLLRNMQEAAWQDERSLKTKMLQDPEVQALSSLFGPQRETRALQAPSPIQQAVDYVSSTFRAAMSLSKAYRASRKQQNMGPTPLDCIWTLYCRNLDKTADIDGPYGALAKLNRLGLKVMMGKVPLGRVLDKLMAEFSAGNKTTALDCSKLFPRCSLEEAKAIVKATVGGDSLSS